MDSSEIPRSAEHLPPGETEISAQRPMGDWGFVFLIAASLLSLVYISILLLYPESEDHLLTTNTLSVLTYLGPCVLAWRASRHPALSPRTSRGWLFVSAANLSFLLGNAVWMYCENYLGTKPFPSLADVGYLLYYPLLMVGLLSLMERFRSFEERLNFWLDAGVIMSAAGMVVWFFLLRPMSEAADDDTLKTVLSLAYPIGDLVMLLGIASLLMRRSELGSSLPVNVLLSGVIINFIADFIFAYQNLNGTYQTGTPMDTLFTIAGFPVMLGAYLQYRAASHESYSTAAPSSSLPRFFWAPYMAVLVVHLGLLEIVFLDGDPVLESFVVVAGVVTVLVLVRQFMFVRENTKAHLALSELQELIHGIFSASTDAIGLADLNGRITEVNESFLRVTGYSREEIVGHLTHDSFVPGDILELSIAPDPQLETKRNLEYERELTRKDGTKRTVTITLYTVSDAHGNPAATAIVIRDITDRRALERKLMFQALHDPLTGLANRASLTDRAANAIARAKRRKRYVSMLFLDLDNFKPVNDTLGHTAGDELLRLIGERINKCIREGDTAARVGGDEFAILLEDLSEPGEEIKVAERIIHEVRKPATIGGKTVFVGTSIGVALSSQSCSTVDDLIRNADVAMYAAKREGKNCYRVFKDEMGSTAIRRAQLINQLREAVSKNELSLKYQPIVSMTDDRMVAVEALLRWNPADGVEITPGEFIPLAEEANLMPEIGKFVLAAAVSQCAAWKRELGLPPEFSVSVNISSRQFLDERFGSMLEEAIADAGLPPSNLILEITESTMLTNSSETVGKFNSIRKLGVRLAIDDFGTGYSSLAYLQKFPIDVLKIDKSFVQEVTQGKEGAAMTGAIVSMSQTLRLTTIAEGVESKEQAELLRALGCDLGQGYLYSIPVTADQIEAMLRSQPRDGNSEVLTNEEFAMLSQNPTLSGLMRQLA